MAKATSNRKKFEGIKALTPTFRASFLTVFEPRAFEEGAEPKYSVEMLFSKKGSDLTELKKKMKAVCVAAWGKEESKWPKNFRWPFKDGDDMPEDMKESSKEIYAGHLIARADSKQPPGIYDETREDIIDKREFYSGCYARASLYMVPYENVGGRDGRSGVKLYLQGIQRVKKGEALGGNGAREDFDDVTDDQNGDDEDPGF